MKPLKLILSISICLFLLACSKKDIVTKSGNSANNNCILNSYLPSIGNVLSQHQQNEYFYIWKSIVKDQSLMPESYFDTHIVDYNISSIAWNAGVSFRIDYQLKIDWMTINCKDEFLVKMNSSHDAYEHLNIPRDVYFNKNQIESNINNIVYSEISSYNLLDQLKYNNCDELETAIKDSTGYNVAIPELPTYFVPGKLPREDGDPYVLIKGTINKQENKCLEGYINLNSGEWEVWEDVCVQ